MMNHIVIVGGGIAGLASAYYAQKKAASLDIPLKISLLEADSYWGGKILTKRVNGFVIEGGPDTFIVTKPWAVQLCRDLDISHRLKGTNPHQKNTYILHNNKLLPLPDGLFMMIPTNIASMLRTGLLSWSAKLRMGMDFFIPPLSEIGEESMGDFVTRRIGRQAYERMVEPLMSGIYAGDGDKLSLQATFPYLRDLEIKHGGLVKGALAARRSRVGTGKKPAPGSRSLFLTLKTGLVEIVEALVAELEDAQVDLSLNTPVVDIRQENEGYTLLLQDGQEINTFGLILAVPSYVAGDLVTELTPNLAQELKAIEYVTTATVSLAFRKEDLVRPLDGYGYVIPRKEGRLALACTWTSTKFPHRAPEENVLLRVFIGRAGQEAQIDWDEAELLSIARNELRLTLGISAEPLQTHVFLWEKAMPQYNVGHVSRLSRIESELDNLPGLALAGNGYTGIGIPDCIHSGELAVERILKKDARTVLFTN